MKNGADVASLSLDGPGFLRKRTVPIHDATRAKSALKMNSLLQSNIRESPVLKGRELRQEC